MKRLTSRVVPAGTLSQATARDLYTIFGRHYDCVTWDNFSRDLSQKDFVVLLADQVSGELRGFSTQQVLETIVHGTRVRAIFSGDTIIDREYWGEQELVRGWCRFAGQVLAAEPHVPLYWFLISKGYRTYLFLPLFYREYYPRPNYPAPAFEQEVMDLFACARFPGFYNPTAGLIEFPRSQGHLNSDLAEIPLNRRNHPQVQFFLSRNPDYARGNELVCLAAIHPDNMKSFARNALLEGMTTGWLEEQHV